MENERKIKNYQVCYEIEIKTNKGDFRKVRLEHKVINEKTKLDIINCLLGITNNLKDEKVVECARILKIIKIKKLEK